MEERKIKQGVMIPVIGAVDTRELQHGALVDYRPTKPTDNSGKNLSRFSHYRGSNLRCSSVVQWYSGIIITPTMILVAVQALPGGGNAKGRFLVHRVLGKENAKRHATHRTRSSSLPYSP